MPFLNISQAEPYLLLASNIVCVCIYILLFIYIYIYTQMNDTRNI